jgi:orotate phosphoribosyltransferase
MALRQQRFEDCEGLFADRDKLFALLKTDAFRKGPITLSSGKVSDFYFDMKGPMMHPDGAALIADLILNELSGVEADYVGGLELGAAFLIAPVAMQSQKFGRFLPGFAVRKKRKEHGTQQLIEGANIDGKNVVILDDVTTSGGSAMQAVEEARNAGANVTLVLSVVDRGEGAAEKFEAAGVKFRSLFRADEFRNA